jgi:hypothetical protein
VNIEFWSFLYTLSLPFFSRKAAISFCASTTVQKRLPNPKKMTAQEKKLTAQEIANGCAGKKIGCAGKLKRVATHFFK